MRITNNMVLRNSLAGLQNNRSDIQRLQTQITSGVGLTIASDDPTGADQVMTSSSSISAIDQYKRNIDSATARNNVEDSGLARVTDLLTRAREVMVSQNTATATAATRTTASKELEEIFNSVVAIGNSKVGDTYLFGGDNATATPFATTGTGATLDFTTTTPVGTQSTQVGNGQSLVPTHDGNTAFINSGVLTSLRDAARALANNDTTAGAAAMDSMDGAFQQVQVLAGETGAKRNSLDIASQNLSALKSNLTTFRSSLQDVDIEAAVTTLVTKQTAYQAAMMATSKVLGMSLTDYLR